MFRHFLNEIRNSSRNSNMPQSPKTINARCRYCGKEFTIPDMFHVERVCPACQCMNIFEKGMALDFSSIVPFDVKTLPDVYASMQGKIDLRFPDDVGQPGSGLSEELWIHDNYVIQFNTSSLYYINIVSREYGSVSLDEIRKYLDGKTWMIQAFNISKEYQEEIRRVCSLSPAVVDIGNAYMGIMQTLLLFGITSEQQKTMEKAIAEFERFFGVKYIGRKWARDGKEVTWGQLLHAIYMSYGMKKLY